MTNHVSKRIRKDLKSCIQRREETYKLAYKLIESVASNEYKSRQRNGANDDKIIRKFRNALNDCRVDSELFFTYYNYLPQEELLSWKPPKAIVAKGTKKQKKLQQEQAKRAQEDYEKTMQKLNLLNSEQIQPHNEQYNNNNNNNTMHTANKHSTLELFERYPVLGHKLIVALAADVTHHVPLYNVILKDWSLKELNISLKKYINKLPLKAILMPLPTSGKTNKACELFEAAIELQADITFQQVVNPFATLSFEESSDKNYYQTETKRTDMLKILMKYPKFIPKDNDVKGKDLISKLLSDALQRREIPIVQFLSNIKGVKAKLVDLLDAQFPIDDVTAWEDLVKNAIQVENFPLSTTFTSGTEETEACIYLITDVIWQLQQSEHRLLSAGGRRVELIKFALDKMDENQEWEDNLNLAKNEMGIKMSEIMTGWEEAYCPWFNHESRLFREAVDPSDPYTELYKVQPNSITKYCQVGMYNYITQAFVDENIELIELFLQSGASVSSRGFLDSRIFQQLLVEFPLLANPNHFFSSHEVKDIKDQLKNIITIHQPGSSKNTNWQETGLTPMHVLLQMDSNNVKKNQIINAVGTRCSAYIDEHSFRNVLEEEGGVTISEMIENIADDAERKEMTEFIKTTNAKVQEMGRQKKQQKKKKTKGTVKGTGKKGQDKAVSKLEKRERNDMYEALLKSFIAFKGDKEHGPRILINTDNGPAERLRDPDVHPDNEAARGQMKTVIRGGGGGGGGGGGAEGETKESKDSSSSSSSSSRGRRYGGETKSQRPQRVQKSSTLAMHRNTKWEERDGGDGETMCILDGTWEGLGSHHWEIKATDAFLKYLRRMRKKNPSLMMAIQRNVNKLARGDWEVDKKGTGEPIAKPLSFSDPKMRGFELYEMKFKDRKVRVYWELKVDRSRHQNRDMKKQTFTQMILIHNAGRKHVQKDMLEKIKNSYKKKENVQLRRELTSHYTNKQRGTDKTLRDTNTGNRLPYIFDSVSKEDYGKGKHYRGENLKEDMDEKGKTILCVQGPAVSDMKKFGMQLTYMWNSNFMMQVLYSDFKPTIPINLDPEEQKLIAFVPNPASSMLLLGRSGTGKTTCLVYRIWNDYKAYWKNIGSLVEQRKADYKGDQKKKAERKKMFTPTAVAPTANGDAAAPNEQQPVVEEEEGGEGEEQEKEEAHQHFLFITKSAGLRWEIREQFRKIRETDCQSQITDAQLKHPKLSMDDAIALQPPTFPDDQHPSDPKNLVWSLNRLRPTDSINHPGVSEEKWPIFLAEHEWLHILDHTLPINPDMGRFKAFYDHHRYADDGNDDDDDDDEDDEDLDSGSLGGESKSNSKPLDETWFWDLAQAPPSTNTDEDNEESSKKINFKARQVGDERNGFVEITYEIFRDEFYPKFKGYNMEADASLVFSEIKSHIQGSVEALDTLTGHLDRNGKCFNSLPLLQQNPYSRIPTAESVTVASLVL